MHIDPVKQLCMWLVNPTLLHGHKDTYPTEHVYFVIRQTSNLVRVVDVNNEADILLLFVDPDGLVEF